MIMENLISFWILLIFLPISLQFNYISVILKEFDLKSPHFIGPLKEFPLDFIKSLHKNGNSVIIHTQVKDVEFNKNAITDTIIFINSNINDVKIVLNTPKSLYRSLILITKSNKIEEILNLVASKTVIDQKVFILTNDSQEMYEAYTINNLVVTKKMGHVDLLSNNFKWGNNVNPDFIKRRSDFQGIVLKGMVEFAGMDLNADLSYLEKAPYFQANQTYQVNNFIYGLFNDIMKTLQDQLNFTTVLYKNKEVSWGYVYQHPNGSYEGTGIVADLFFKKADIALASLHMKIERALFIDYLPPINMYYNEIYIPISNTDKIDFKTYLAPFTTYFWTTITLMGCIFAIIKLSFLKMHGNMKKFGFDHIWTSFSGFFGGKPSPTPIDSIPSYKTAIVVTLLCGTISWIAYRGFLVGELSVIEKEYPFYDMESFSKTNWR